MAPPRRAQSVAALIDALINDPQPDVREQAAKSLGKIGDRMALPFLQAAQNGDNVDSVREMAEKALNKIQETAP